MSKTAKTAVHGGVTLGPLARGVLAALLVGALFAHSAYADPPTPARLPSAPPAPTPAADAGVHAPASTRFGSGLSVFVGVGYLASLGQHGGAFSLGVRMPATRHLALSLDLGYGVLGAEAPSASTNAAARTVEDRWWIMPSVAVVLPAGRARFDLGAGVGLGATSGYLSGAAYEAAPFGPAWAYQLVPALRAHAIVSFRVRPTVDLFARFDAATLLLDDSSPGRSIGSRVGNPRPPTGDTIWMYLHFGASFEVL